MRLHAARGDRVRAMRAYHAYAALAQRELGIVPGAGAARRPTRRCSTIRPLDAERAHAAADRPHAPSASGCARSGGGRERGHAQLALVTGEPGIGKSRLVEELRATCGAPSAEARAYAAEGSVAYGPVVAWLRSDALAPRLRRLDPRTRPSSRGCCPSSPPRQPRRLARARAPRRPPPTLAAAGPRRRARPPRRRPPQAAAARRAARRASLPPRTSAHAAVRRVAHALLGTGAPLLLVADDLQYFDVPTLQFLHYLLRARGAAAGGGDRAPRGARRRPPGGRARTGLQALGRCTEIALGRLDARGDRRSWPSSCTARRSTREADRLFAASEGNPLYLVEAAQAGARRRPRAGDDRGAARPALPARRASWRASRRRSAASSPARSWPTRATSTPRAFVRGLDELWRRGIVRAHEHDLYDFSHGRIREAAYDAARPRAAPRPPPARGACARARRPRRSRRPGRAVRGGGRERRRAALVPARRRGRAAASTTTRAPSARSSARWRCLRGPAERELELLTALPAPLNALDGYRSPRLEHVHERAFALADELGVEPEAPLVRSRARRGADGAATSTPRARRALRAAARRARRASATPHARSAARPRRPARRGRVDPRDRRLLERPARGGARPPRGRARALAARAPRGAPAALRPGHRAHVPDPARAHAVAARRPRRRRAHPRRRARRPRRARAHARDRAPVGGADGARRGRRGRRARTARVVAEHARGPGRAARGGARGLRRRARRRGRASSASGASSTRPPHGGPPRPASPGCWRASSSRPARSPATPRRAWRRASARCARATRRSPGRRRSSGCRSASSAGNGSGTVGRTACCRAR